MTADRRHEPGATGREGGTTPHPGNGRSPSSDTRSALLDAGRILFARQGFDGTTVRDITGHAGANLGAVTYHFGSKRALYAAVLDQELTPLAESVARVGRSEGTALDRILRVVERYFEHLAEHTHLPRLLLQEIAAGRIPPDPVVSGMQTVAGTLANLQREGERDGSVRPGMPILTALSVISQPVFMNLVLPMATQVIGLDMSTPQRRADMMDHATAFVRRGLEPRSGTTPPQAPPPEEDR
jgi:AcrR family transcriptional regulator